MTAYGTECLSAFLATIRREDIPPGVTRRVRLLLLDGIACGLVGAHLPWARRAVEGTARVDNGTGATLWGWGRQVSPQAAALLNGTFVQGFELDDFHAHGALHSSSVVVTAALAAAESVGSVGLPEFLRALVLGYETGPRVGIAMGGGRLSTLGWHTGAVYGPFAAAAAAGAILGLDARQFSSALGNAGTRASGLMAAQYKSMVKRMHHGMAAQAGLHGAALASVGFLGTERIIEHDYGGLASTILGSSSEADLAALSGDLGTRWTLMDIGVKRHAAMIMTHSAIDCLVAERKQGLDPGSVRRLTIKVSESVHRRTAWKLERPGSPLSAQLNQRFAAAVALLDGAAYVDQFRPESLARPAIWELMDRVDVVHAKEIDDRGQERRFATILEIDLRDGRRLRREGTPPQDRPFEADAVVEKFRGLVRPLMTERRLTALEELVLNGGDDASTAALTALLAEPVASAIPGLE